MCRWRGRCLKTVPELHIDAKAWLIAHPKSSYAEWKKNMPCKGIDIAAVLSKNKNNEKSRDKVLERRMTRVKFLMEKYGSR